MHDPCSVAFEIYLGKKQKKNGNYRSPFITIWHVDPEKDGTDDSCGHFIRERHVDPEIVKRVRREFESSYYEWFDKSHNAKFTPGAMLLNIYRRIAWTIFFYENNGKSDWKRVEKFMRKHVCDILIFAENDTDSVRSVLINPLEGQERKERLPMIVMCDILRKERKWYQHPKWHVHHWKIQFTFFRGLKRRYWDKCCVCGKRGFKRPALGDWSGKVWHPECNSMRKTLANERPNT